MHQDANALFDHANALVAADDVDAAFKSFESAANAGHADATLQLSRMLLHGVGTHADPAAAVRWLQRAEASGSAAAGCTLAMVAVGNTALPRDAAIDQRVLAAVNSGHSPALRTAAIHFGRKPHADDQALCLRLLQQAAAQGDATCALLLAARLQSVDPAAAAALHAELAAHGIAPLPSVTAALPAQPDGPPGHLELTDALVPAPARVLSTAPRVAVVDGLLSADECRLLIASARPMLRGSRATDPHSGAAVALPVRTSSDAAMDPLVEDLALRLVQLRIAASAGIELVHAEHLTVLRYAPGEQYRPHRDYLPAGAIERDRPQAGNRRRTICVYLNDVDAGGETEFPTAGVRVAPTAGSAVLFDNLHDDGAPDVDSLHAGLPVQRGEKWLATLWLRERPYRTF